MGKRIAYEPYDCFMLRAPLLPVGFLAAIPDSPEKLFSWLNGLWKDPLIREGILLASYEFSEAIDREFKKKGTETPEPGLLYALLRYICRFSSRCTPFGTFSGFCAGKIGHETAIRLDEKLSHRLHARPDMEYLMEIVRVLETDSLIREKLVFTPNTSLYRLGEKWHYVEINPGSGKSKKSYDIVTIEDNGIIADILRFCRSGKTLDSIRKSLEEGGWNESEVFGFVESLVESQVLVTGLEPVICGPEYIDCLLSKLNEDFYDHKIVQALSRLKGYFDQMCKPSSVLVQLPMIEQIMADIPVSPNRSHLIQVDMMLSNSTIQLGSLVSGQILLGLRIIRALSSRRKPDGLKGFREAFLKRYGDRKVALVKALDPETGIGLEGSGEGYWTDPVPWLDDLRWGAESVGTEAGTNLGNSWLTSKYIESIREGLAYIDLLSTDLQSIGIHDGNWPTQMTAMVELFEDEGSGEPGIHFLMGSSGNPAYLLGRFAYGDPDITQFWISRLIADEKADYPDALYAEVIHLPEDRTGNVLQRPSFLDYEIPYLAASVKPGDKQILITDLMVAVEDQRIVLYSNASGKQVQPAMTNAYNHQLGNLAVYKFLHRIRVQNHDRGYYPDWGDAVSQGTFIPGIRFKNIILAAPSWLIRCQELTKWIRIESGQVDLDELLAWKNGRQMPDEMLWVMADQELYFSWTSACLVLALWDAIRHRSVVRVRPFYLSQGSPVISPDGWHANQIVLCYKKS
jgi:hypothetical protein